MDANNNKRGACYLHSKECDLKASNVTKMYKSVENDPATVGQLSNFSNDLMVPLKAMENQLDAHAATISSLNKKIS